MNNYNQTVSTTTSTCLENSVAGYYCSVYQNETVTTYNYFDLLVLISGLIIFVSLIGFFRNLFK